MTSPFRQALVLAAVALVAGTVSNQAAAPKRHLKWVGDWKGKDTPVAVASAAAPAQSPAAVRAEDSVELGSDEVLEAQQTPGVIFLDARRSEMYNQGHIPGARDFAVWEGDIDDKVMALATEVPPNTRIVVYCTGGECDDSHLLRNKLLGVHFTSVGVYSDGWPDWLAKGRPSETVGH